MSLNLEILKDTEVFAKSVFYASTQQLLLLLLLFMGRVNVLYEFSYYIDIMFARDT